MASHDDSSNIPAGWFLANDKLNGKTVECYTNVLGQKYYSMEDLMRYVNYAQRAQVSIYSLGFDCSTMEDSSSAAISGASSRTTKKGINRKAKKNPRIASKQKKHFGDTSARKSSLGPAHASNEGEKSSTVTELPGKTRRLSQIEPQYLPDPSTIHAQEVAGNLWASRRITELVADTLPDSEATKHPKEVATVELAEMSDASETGATSSA